MKYYLNILLTSILVIICTTVFCQSFNWVKHEGGFGYDISSASCKDLNGNIYISAVGGGGGNTVIIANDTFSVSGQDDMFLIKYDPNGNHIWTKQFGGNNYQTIPTYYAEAITNVVFDSASNCIYITGTYYQICQFDTITLNAQSGYTDNFLARLDANGNFIWVKNISSLPGGVESGNILSCDQNGSLFILSGFSNGGYIDSVGFPLGNSLATILIDGTMKGPPVSLNLNSYQIINMQYSSGSLLMLGGSNDTLTIDTIYIDSINSSSGILTCWDTTGHILWERHTMDGNVYTGNFTYDDIGNIIVTYYFQDPWIILGNDTVFSNGNTGGVLLKMNKFGITQWIKSVDVGLQYGYFPASIQMDSENGFYIAGNMKDSLSFGNISIVSPFPGNFYNSFVARFDTSGNCIGAVQADNVQVTDMEVDNTSNVYLTGGFSNTAHFGNITLVTNNSSDIFLANLNAITGLGGGERMIQDQLVIYANPNKGSFRVQVPEQLSDLRGAWLFVYDVQGKEVARFNLDKMNETPQLEINNANAGFYTVRLVKDKQVFIGKMVVE